MDTQALFLFIAGSILPSFFVALLSTYLVRANAARFGLIDLPGGRKVHTPPTPRGGGVAVWLGVVAVFAIGQLVLILADKNASIDAQLPEILRMHRPGILSQSPKLWILLAGGTALML